MSVKDIATRTITSDPFPSSNLPILSATVFAPSSSHSLLLILIIVIVIRIRHVLRN